MQIFVNDIAGRTITLDVEPSDSIQTVRSKLQQTGCHEGYHREGYHRVRLVFAGKELKDECTVHDYGIHKESTLFMLLRVMGGGKKRKKKVFTTPKKTKHVKKKEKMPTSKYYEVDENGKLTCLRRECPNESCGAGTFMAQHFNRQSCGKCGLTFMFEEPKEAKDREDSEDSEDTEEQQ